MDNLIVITSRDISQQELRSFVESWGGYWNEEPTFNNGVVERRPSAIYVSLGNRREIKQDYEPHEIKNLTLWLGEAPKACIDIHIGHGRGSQKLAHEFAQAAIAEWQGYLDEGREDIGPPPPDRRR